MSVRHTRMWFCGRSFGVEQVKKMRAHGRHTGTSAYKHHFALCWLNKELTIRARNGHFVAGFTRENKGRTNTRIHIHKATLFLSQGGVAMRILSIMIFPSAGWLAME